MKELLSIEKINYDNWLTDYSLSIYEGDVIYVQCLSEQSLDCLSDIIAGNQKPDSGKIYVNEQEEPGYGQEAAGRHGIYAASLETTFEENGTVLQAIMPWRPFWHIYSKRRVAQELAQIFAEQQVPFEPDTCIWELTAIERKTLGILKAKIRNDKLIVLNISRETIEGSAAEELWRIMGNMKKEGVTFLILSSQYSIFAEYASRVQLIHEGRAVKEWSGKIPETVIAKLKNGQFGGGQEQKQVVQKHFVGLYDYEWDTQRSFWEYLSCVKEENPKIWESHFLPILPPDGVGYLEKTVVVPRNSHKMIFKELTIGQNLTLLAADRLKYDCAPVVNPRLQRKLEENYYREQGMSANEVNVDTLSRVQKKILSIERFAILRPKILFLERPYAGMGFAEVQKMRSYLFRLHEKGIKVVCFSKSLENMRMDCEVIIRTQNGASAEIDT